MASGNGGQIALARVASLYSTVNTYNLWANFTSETLEHKLDALLEASLNGRRDEPPSYKGTDHGDGDIQIEPNPNFMGHLLNGWFGQFTSSTVTGATSTGANSGQFAGVAQTFHRFTPDQSPYSDRTYQDPYQIAIYRDVGSMWSFQGAIFPMLKFELQAGQLVKMTAQVMARNVGLTQYVGAIQSLVSSGGRPWIWDMASIELSTDTTSANLVANTKFEQLTITCDLPNAGITLLDGTKQYAEFVPTNFRSIKIDGTMSFRDQADYLTFRTYEAVRMRATLLNVNSALALGNVASLDATKFLGYFGLRFHFPQMKFLSWSAPIAGPNRIVAKFTAKAEYNDAEQISAAVELNNVVTSTTYSTTY